MQNGSRKSCTNFQSTSDVPVSLLRKNVEINLKPQQILQLTKQLSSTLNNDQKTNLLEHLMSLMSLGHLESLRFASHLHSTCHRMLDCCDFVTWLPEELVLRVFSHLSWESLISCSLVNKTWSKTARHPDLYRQLCMMSEWASPILKTPVLQNRKPQLNDTIKGQCNGMNEYNTESMTRFESKAVNIDWFSVFKKRMCLRRNFRLGKHRIRQFNGHNGAVYCVDCDAYRIVSGSADSTIRVWNIRTNAKWSVQTLNGHSAAVRCIQLIPLPTTEKDNHCTATVHCVHESIASIPCLLCSPNYITHTCFLNCLQPPEVLLISGSADTTLKLWRVSTTMHWSRIACVCTLQGHTDTVRCVQADQMKVISGSYDCTLRMWNLATNHVEKVFRGHSAGVICLVYDDQFLYSGSLDNTVRIWSLSTGVCTYTLSRSNDSPNPEMSLSPVSSLYLDTSNGRLVIAHHDGTILTWILPNNDNLTQRELSSTSLESNMIYLTEKHLFSNDGRPDNLIRCLAGDAWHIICGSDDGSIKIWRTDNNLFVNSLFGHQDGVTCVFVSGSVIVSGSYDKSVILYDLDVSTS